MFNSSLNSISGATKLLAPVSENHTPSAGLYPYIIAAVSGLLVLSSPSAILGAIVSVDFDSVQRVVARGSATHVFDKVLEGEPSLAHLNTSPSVSAPITIGRSRVAPGLHVAPRIVFRDQVPPARQAVPVMSAALLPATRLSLACSDVAHDGCACVSAIALPAPVKPTIVLVVERRDSQLAESLSGQIPTEFTHNNLSICCSCKIREAGCKSVSFSVMNLASMNILTYQTQKSILQSKGDFSYGDYK